MKNLFSTTFFFLLFICLSCHDEDIPEIKSQLSKFNRVEKASVKDQPYLFDLLGVAGFKIRKSDANSRTNNNAIEISTDSVLMALQADSFTYIYTFKVITNSASNSFTNLVFKRVVGGYKAFYLKYEATLGSINRLESFTGTITRTGIENESSSVLNLVNGHIISTQNGRAQCAASFSIKNECTRWDPVINPQSLEVTGFDCYSYITVITIDACIEENSGTSGGGSFTWSNGTFVRYDGGPGGGGPGNPGGNPSCPTGDGGSGLSNGDDPNACSNNVPVFPPTLEEVIDKWEEDNIDDTLLKPCMKTILTDLKNLTQGSVGQIIQKFSGNIPGYNWEVKDGVLSNENAATSQTYNKASGTVSTIFDASKMKNATDLSIARTILHEAVHAYLIALAKTNPLEASNSYATLIKDLGTLGANDAQHAQFVRSFVNDIAASLKEYGQKKGYTLSTQSYQDLAWGGLTHTTDAQGNTIETSWFIQSFPNISNRKRIIDTINIELTKKDSNGNTKSQKGNLAGC